MPKTIKRGIYLIEFSDGAKMIFGNNYKEWWEHAREFIFRTYGDREHGWRYDDIAGKVSLVKYSNQPFFDDGGLKWCDLKGYQDVIDEVSLKQKIVRIELIIFYLIDPKKTGKY